MQRPLLACMGRRRAVPSSPWPPPRGMPQSLPDWRTRNRPRRANRPGWRPASTPRRHPTPYLDQASGLHHCRLGAPVPDAVNRSLTLEWQLSGILGREASRPVMAVSRLFANRCRTTRRLSRKTLLAAKAPRNVIAAHRRSQLLANALFKHGTPRHQAETQAIIQHRKAAA